MGDKLCGCLGCVSSIHRCGCLYLVKTYFPCVEKLVGEKSSSRKAGAFRSHGRSNTDVVVVVE